jgi:hypothetical protein
MSGVQVEGARLPHQRADQGNMARVRGHTNGCLPVLGERQGAFGLVLRRIRPVRSNEPEPSPGRLPTPTDFQVNSR